jgi:hypothetical protein
MILYRGWHVDRGLHVQVIDTTDPDQTHYLPPVEAAKLLNCSPDYSTGSSDINARCLAVALLLHVTGSQRKALDLSPDFVMEFLYGIPHGKRWTIEQNEIWKWLAAQKAKTSGVMRMEVTHATA